MANEKISAKDWMALIENSVIMLPAYFTSYSGFDPQKIKHVSKMDGIESCYLQNPKCILEGYYKPIIRIHNTQ